MEEAIENGMQHFKEVILGTGGAEDIFAEYKDREDKPLKQFGIFGIPVEVSDKRHGELLECVGTGELSVIHAIQMARDSFHDMLESDITYDKCKNTVQLYTMAMTAITRLKDKKLKDKKVCAPFRVVSPDFIERAEESYMKLFELLTKWKGIERKIKYKNEVNSIIKQAVATTMAPHAAVIPGSRPLGGSRKKRRTKRRRTLKR
jgi:hypothetical protein